MMSNSYPRPFRISVPLVLFTLLLAGCGDVQGEAEALTLSVDGRGSSYLAVQDGWSQEDRVQKDTVREATVQEAAVQVAQAGFQDDEAGSGAWTPLVANADTPHKLTLTDPRGRYGVLSLCLDQATGNLSVNVQHGVVSQTPVVSANCLAAEPVATVSVSGSVRGLSGSAYGNVYLGEVSALVDSATPKQRLELPAALYDLVAARYEGAERVPSRLVLEPELSIKTGTELEVDFNGPFSFRPETAQLFVDGVRTGELLSGSVELVTPGGTAARVGEYTSGNALAYARLPAGLVGQALTRGMRLRAEMQSFSYNDRTKAGSSRNITRILPGAPEAPVSVKLPQPVPPPDLTLYGGLHLRPGASWQAHPAGGGRYAQFYSQVRDGHTVSYRLSQSTAWLAVSPEGRLSYTLPDFSTLPDWQAEWNLTRGEELFWDVSFTQKTPLKELSVSCSGVLAP